MANILLNGGKKYNKSKRKNTKKNRKNKNKKIPETTDDRQTAPQDIKANKYWKPEKFRFHKEELSIISFENGMFGKDSSKTHSLPIGVTGVLWQQLKYRQSSGDTLFAYVDEFQTSKTCHPCNNMSLTVAYIGLNSALTCKNCGTMW
ncbi:hypothetical protein INT46_002731 [Mucor plumbeus]|uniref:Cas12f1-like TNB domain-containing protein n=1 Tax=Mucor plumbeus TaxID=97098 RepID=A0A8H7QW41_9FUNG|nr:hypothetical protein INT46_002731 [Mucor plumbeus]